MTSTNLPSCNPDPISFTSSQEKCINSIINKVILIGVRWNMYKYFKTSVVINKTAENFRSISLISLFANFSLKIRFFIVIILCSGGVCQLHVRALIKFLDLLYNRLETVQKKIAIFLDLSKTFSWKINIMMK